MLIGRDQELARLGDLLAAAAAGHAVEGHAAAAGGVLVLRGEAGVGKSALLAEAAVRASGRGALVLRTTGVQAETDVPFSGLHQLLRPLVDPGGALPAVPAAARATVLSALGIAGAGVAAPQPFRVALAVLDALTSAALDRPVVLVVDDAHWLDEASWDVLSFVGRRLESDPVVLLLALREGADADRRLSAAGLAELAVAPLPGPSAAALLDSRAPGLPGPLRARLLAEAAGNPLALVELPSVAARFGEGVLLPAWLPLPVRLERAFSVLAAELPPTTRTLLLVTALDDGGRLDELLAVGSAVEGTPITVDDLQPALAAHLAEVDDAFVVHLRHPLMRSALRQAATVSRRRQVHAALAGMHGRGLRGGDRAVWHRAAAAIGADDGVARDLAAVAARARRRGAAATAVSALERSAELSTDRATRAVRLLEAAEAAVELGSPAALARLARDLADEDLPPLQRARLSWLQEAFLGAGWSGSSRFPALLDVVERFRADGDHEAALECLSNLGLRSWWSNPEPRVRAAVLAAADRLDVDPADPRLVSVLALVGPVERGAQVLDRLAGSSLHQDPEQLHLLGTAASAVGALGRAAVFSAAAAAGLRDQGRLGLLAQALVDQAWTAAQLADTRLCLTASAEARAMSRETGQPRWALTADLARAAALALRGDGPAARALADEGERVLLPMGALPVLALVQLVRGVEALGAGRHPEAWDHLSRVLDPADAAHHPYVGFWLVGHLAEAGVHSGRASDVRAIAAELAPVAERTRSPVLAAGLAYAAALLAPDEDADRAFRAGLGGDPAPSPFERARLQLGYGAWLRRRRRPAESRPHLRGAAATFDALGTAPWADRAREELRASGESVRRPDDAADALTPQELQIAQLAADGLSNREVAERLYLSPRTVSTHLYRIFPKLGVGSRGELARALSGSAADRGGIG